MSSTVFETEVPRINQADIAAKAGVSVATVNRALNGKTEVSTELSARVQSAIAELGYSWSRSKKRHSSSARSTGIGLLMDLPSIDSLEEFQNRFMVGVESAANAQKRPMVVASYYHDMQANRLPLMLQQGLVEGLIIKGMGNFDGELDWLRKVSQKVPTVVLMNGRPDYDLCSVICDNEGAMYQAIQHLRELDHEHIGFLGIHDIGQLQNPLHDERADAFRRLALKYCVLQRESSMQIPEREYRKDKLGQCIGQALDNWLSMGKQGPTAIVCATDIYAFTLLEEAAKRGLSIPEDLSVIGVMNTVACEHSQPALTSIALSAQEMGKAAVELLEVKIQNPKAPARHVTVASRLVRRQSCCPRKSL